jgi:hypothetical protein
LLLALCHFAGCHCSQDTQHNFTAAWIPARDSLLVVWTLLLAVRTLARGCLPADFYCCPRLLRSWLTAARQIFGLFACCPGLCPLLGVDRPLWPLLGGLSVVAWLCQSCWRLVGPPVGWPVGGCLDVSILLATCRSYWRPLLRRPAPFLCARRYCQRAPRLPLPVQPTTASTNNSQPSPDAAAICMLLFVAAVSSTRANRRSSSMVATAYPNCHFLLCRPLLVQLLHVYVNNFLYRCCGCRGLTRLSSFNPICSKLVGYYYSSTASRGSFL